MFIQSTHLLDYANVGLELREYSGRALRPPNRHTGSHGYISIWVDLPLDEPTTLRLAYLGPSENDGRCRAGRVFHYRDTQSSRLEMTSALGRVTEMERLPEAGWKFAVAFVEACDPYRRLQRKPETPAGTLLNVVKSG